MGWAYVMDHTMTKSVPALKLHKGSGEKLQFYVAIAYSNVSTSPR